MKLDNEVLIKRLDELIGRFLDVSFTPSRPDLFIKFKTSVISTLGKLYTPGDIYYKEAINLLKINSPDNNAGVAAILGNIIDDIKSGWFTDFKSLISAEIFSNYLDKAAHLIDEGYKDPAAVIIGSTLEEHLRKLCLNNNISVTLHKSPGKEMPKKADLMNSELVKANVYNGLDGKNVTAWLDLRNKAAHGEYSKYGEDHVKLMYRGISDFISRHK